MKKVFSVLAIATLTVMLCMSLTACGALAGSYSAGLTTYTFSGNNVTVETTLTIGSLTTTNKSEGTYKVEEKDGKKTLTITYKDGDATNEISYALVNGKDDNGEYIKLDGTTYYKK